MALINRFTRLFKADLHAVLDRIEEPESLLRQSLREMEEALGRDQQRDRRLRQEHSEILARERELGNLLRELDEELDTCFEFERDDLARAQIKRKLEAERQKKHLGQRRETLEETLQRCGTRIEENVSRLESARRKAELWSPERSDSRATADSAGVDFEGRADFTVSAEEVEVAFLRAKQRRGER